MLSASDLAEFLFKLTYLRSACEEVTFQNIHYCFAVRVINVLMTIENLFISYGRTALNCR